MSPRPKCQWFIWACAVLLIGGILDAADQTPQETLGAISGVISNGASGAPVGRAIVNLFGASTGAATTDTRGRFVFMGVQPGAYALTVQKAGFLESAFGRDTPLLDSFALNVGPIDARTGVTLAPLVLAAGEWMDTADVKLWPAGSIRGAVLDDQGSPVVGRLVRAITASATRGIPELSLAGAAVTDDRGLYSIGRLAPGAYYLAVLAFDALRQETAPAATSLPGRYYPSATRLTGAVPVELRPGAHLEGIDVRLQAVASHGVSGVVRGATVEDLPSVTLALVRAGDRDAGMSSRAALAQVRSDGTFSFPAVPDGDYVVTTSPTIGRDEGPLAAFGAGPRLWQLPQRLSRDGAPYWADVPLTVAGLDETGLVVTLRRAATISGVVVRDASAPPTLPFPRLFGETADAGGPRAETAIVTPDRSGSFIVDGLRSGPQFLRAAAGPPTFIRSIQLGGREYLDQPLDLSGGDVSGVIVKATKGSRLTGIVRDESGRGARLSCVVYFPVDRAVWAQVSSGSPRFGLVPSRTDGTYDTFGLLPGGEYYVLAVSSAWRDRWDNARFLEAAAGLATIVSLDWASSAQQDLKLREVSLR